MIRIDDHDGALELPVPLGLQLIHEGLIFPHDTADSEAGEPLAWSCFLCEDNGPADETRGERLWARLHARLAALGWGR